jgi:sec-independent protein translocase protein TatB
MGTPLPIEAATIGWADSLILMLMALVVFGPKKLPQLGRQLGKLMYEFRKASNDFKFQMEEELRAAEEADRRKREEAERLQQAALNPPPADASTTATESVAENTDDANNPYLGYTEYVKEQERQAEVPATAEPGTLDVQPPSTGDPVPANLNPPEPMAETLEPVSEAPAASAVEPQPAAATPQATNEKTEAAPHHG